MTRGTPGNRQPVERLPLSQTTEGQAWLSQFDEQDVAGATLLLDSVMLVDTATFESGIEELVRALGHAPRNGATALFAVREVPEPKIDIDNPPPAWAWRPTYFDWANPGTPPNAVAPGAGVGSEGAMSHLVRDLCKRMGRTILDHPSIKQMRAAHCSRVVLVDDIIASGDRTAGFARAFCNNPSIRSWRSFGWIENAVVAFGGTEPGIARVRATDLVDDVRVHQTVAVGRTSWKASQRAEIEAVCKKYAGFTSHSKWPLGYGGVCALTVFYHKCPNNVPPILWSRSRRWKPMFNHRPGLDQGVWSTSLTRAERQLSQAQSVVGGRRAAAGDQVAHQFNAGARALLLVLALCHRRRRRIEQISDSAEFSIHQVNAVIQELQQLGWLNSDRTPTEAGLEQLLHARSLGAVSPSRPRLKGTPYYPMQLRGRQRPFSV